MKRISIFAATVLLAVVPARIARAQGLADRVNVALTEPSAGLAPQQTAPRAAKLRGFSITLLLGDTKAGPSSDVSPVAAKALADLKDFLPYKSFKVLDTQWTAATGGGFRQRLMVPDAVYEVSATIATSASTVYMKEVRLVQMNGNTSAEMKRVLETAVTMSVGETVVVGSSRVQGDTALILLVTAVAAQ